MPDYEVTTFNGLVAPAGTPASIVNMLNAAMNEGLGTPDMRETIAKLGAVSPLGSPEDFAGFIAGAEREMAGRRRSRRTSRWNDRVGG